ncbi:MAG: hypothetical protein PVS3B3_03470 [Ktedonobacteraceae bacterium]
MQNIFAHSLATCYNPLTMQKLQIQQPPVSIPLTDKQFAGAIESVLFVSGRPLERAELRKLLDIDEARLLASLQLLEDELVSQDRGIRLQRLGEQVQLVTAPENAHYIAALLGLPMTAKLTTSALETLAVIAYRQPITRGQIEGVRGVNSDRALASLLQHGLVVEVGRAQSVGRPALFATTPEFLQLFGLTSLEQLPNVQESHGLVQLQGVQGE